ncbi:hypothetical protein [Salinibacter virus M31CR41-3]|nr:hypothetical protein [Salinibacter virus M31CR41-3]
MSYSEEDIQRVIAENEEAFMDGRNLVAPYLEAETEKAIGIPTEGDRDPVWLPKSQIHADEMLNEHVRIALPDWLVESERESLMHVKTA